MRALSITSGSARGEPLGQPGANAAALARRARTRRPGLVHSWPPTSRPSAASSSAIASARSASAPDGDHDRVHAAHLGVDRDRLRPRGGAVVQRPAGRQRAGEADGGISGGRRAPRRSRWRPPSTCANVAVGQAGSATAAATSRGDELARARMRRVALDDDRAARGQRGRGVAAGHAEGQREVAGAEHGHGADRHEHAADVRARDRLASGSAVSMIASTYSPASTTRRTPRADGRCARARRPRGPRAGRSRTDQRNDLLIGRAQPGGRAAQEGRAALVVAPCGGAPPGGRGHRARTSDGVAAAYAAQPAPCEDRRP